MRDEIKERLAAEVHKVWAEWMEYMFSQGYTKKTSHAIFGKPSPEEIWVMPEEKIDRWQRQMKTDYQDLPEGEKESERYIAERYLEHLKEEFQVQPMEEEKLTGIDIENMEIIDMTQEEWEEHYNELKEDYQDDVRKAQKAGRYVIWEEGKEITPEEWEILEKLVEDHKAEDYQDEDA